MKFLFPIPANSIVTQTFAEHVHRARVNGWQNYNGGIDWAVRFWHADQSRPIRQGCNLTRRTPPVMAPMCASSMMKAI